MALTNRDVARSEVVRHGSIVGWKALPSKVKAEDPGLGGNNPDEARHLQTRQGARHAALGAGPLCNLAEPLKKLP